MSWESKSFWLANSGPYTPSPPLQGQIEVDVAILGAGFTGLSTAWHVRRSEPSARVAVLESQVAGFGASGRNAAFAMTVFGLSMTVTALLKGKPRTREAYEYTQQAVDYLGTLIAEAGIDCDYERPGFLRMATTPAYVKRIQEELKLAHELGFREVEWLEADAARARVHSSRYLGAWWEPRMALINPVKMVWGLKRAAQGLGVEIYEHTPVHEVRQSNDRYCLLTPEGTVVARKIVFATNAWSHLIPQIAKKQVPAFTYIVLTEPLSPRHFEAIGWAGREGLEDARNLIHYYRLTPDNRLLMGGGPVGLVYGRAMQRDYDAVAWRHLEAFIPHTFPELADLKIDYRWGGPFSVTLDMCPAIGFVGSPNAIYSVGCIGHGVALTHLNGRLIADLIAERKTPLTEAWFVNRTVLPWPPEPLRLIASVGIRSYLELEDWWYERV
ncbi:MAG: NAD(P)/FAD-dependent oxidoreductase [Candidatus Xenobia bacterium]